MNETLVLSSSRLPAVADNGETDLLRSAAEIIFGLTGRRRDSVVRKNHAEAADGASSSSSLITATEAAGGGRAGPPQRQQLPSSPRAMHSSPSPMAPPSTTASSSSPDDADGHDKKKKKRTREATSTATDDERKEKPTKRKRRKRRVLDTSRSVTPRPNDVLFGRGSHANAHLGNVKFRRRALEYRPLYERSSKEEKRRIADMLVDSVRREGSRFLERGEKGVWHEVIKGGAHTKASQALRERIRGTTMTTTTTGATTTMMTTMTTEEEDGDGTSGDGSSGDGSL
eukprot:CAMPEP_0181119868 /NCGR_PEP_ID=MMETSP1071-20121207/23829_1 /TAXON_ID=35127 /ORGANISM="Thalassiosira sp., Strain NH16" /LENGTH=284 /DNA_ID=CAMNT_0023204439 /DNA_START=40 /DNA_END=894 /DNA_ORIENTATION=-